MYLNFYDLSRKPFQISADPAFLWMGEKHQEALAMLKYGILDNRGFVMLTGNVGTGKTTLINALVNSLGGNVIAATITDPGLEGLDFFNYLADAFDMGESFAGKGEFLIGFRRFLQKSYRDGKQVLLIIDEAQHLGPGMLEEIRLLSNIERQDAKLLNIFLVGQDELNEILERHENRPLRQRMTLHYHLEALPEAELEDMIRYRLKVAGTEHKIFTRDAIREIHAFSKGYPRLVNIICDQALLAGFVADKKAIDASVIQDCARDLKLPRALTPPAVPESAPPPKASPDGQPAGGEKRRGRLLKYVGGLLLLLLLIGGGLYFPYRSGASLPDVAKYWSDQWRRFSYALSSMDEVPNSYRVVKKIPIAETESSAAKPEAVPPAPPVKAAAVAPASKEPSPAAALLPGLPVSEPPSVPASPPPRVPAVQLPGFPVEKRFILSFNYNSNEISSEGYGRLNQTAAAMEANPKMTVTVQGYTDNVGTPAYNTMLSKFRADIVKTYLVSRGISPDRIAAIGKGAETPVGSNASLEGRKINRRVEVEIRE